MLTEQRSARARVILKRCMQKRRFMERLAQQFGFVPARATGRSLRVATMLGATVASGDHGRRAHGAESQQPKVTALACVTSINTAIESWL